MAFWTSKAETSVASEASFAYRYHLHADGFSVENVKTAFSKPSKTNTLSKPLPVAGTTLHGFPFAPPVAENCARNATVAHKIKPIKTMYFCIALSSSKNPPKIHFLPEKSRTFVASKPPSKWKKSKPTYQF